MIPALPAAEIQLCGPRPPRGRSAGLAAGGGGFLLQATGVLLFLFIPLVLYLFVRHPEPIAASLAAGVGLVLGHRFLARPYMVRAMPRKGVWCNPVLPAAPDPPAGTLGLLRGGRLTPAPCCAPPRA